MYWNKTKPRIQPTDRVVVCSHQEHYVITSQTRYERAKENPEGDNRNDQWKGVTAIWERNQKTFFNLKDKNAKNISLKSVRPWMGMEKEYVVMFTIL